MSGFYRPDEFAERVQPVIAAALQDGIGRGEVTRLRRDGSSFPARITLSLLRDEAGVLIGRVLCVQDITDQRKLEEELRLAALYDPLTHLPTGGCCATGSSRPCCAGPVAALASGRYSSTLTASSGSTTRSAMTSATRCWSPSRIGSPNESAVATRWRATGEASTSCCSKISSIAHTRPAIGRRVLAGFAQPVRTTAGDIAVSGSIGIHIAADDDDYDALLKAADRAMYDAKRNGAGSLRLTDG